MEHYGFWSIIPPVAAILLAIKTRQVFLSLLFGIWLGWIIISGGNIIDGSIASVQSLIDVFKDEGSTKTIVFSLLVGSLIALVQRSGGVEGFISKTTKLLQQIETKKNIDNKLLVQLFAFLTGIIIFVETNINALTVGTIYRPLFDKLKLPREKLAYIADSTSAPVNVLVPLNAWGAFIMGLIITNGFDNSFQIMLASIVTNFYPLLSLLLILVLIITKKDYFGMKKAMQRADKEGKLLRDGAVPMISSDVITLDKKKNLIARSVNMLIPISVMIFTMPAALILTGWSSITNPDASFINNLFEAISNGSGSTAVLYAVITAIAAAVLLYSVQRMFSAKEYSDLILKGMSGLVPMALLMLLAFTIGNVSKELGTGIYVAEVSQNWLSPSLIPVLIFLISCFIAFSTGTSWGTFAIMMSIAIPLSVSLGISLPLVVSAVLGGGVFGDHCSPISDTTIISSMATASDHIDHVRTQMPYAVFIGVITAILYLIIGFISY
ncbi:MAG: sodium:solute symporter [Melioribacteraceae bacterium]|nr:sodium:solute symporter [Melioribacteraceae bacterium]MCF8352983.1 sodium:solute symporter [Melioribacteraceae bacterium]MCF8392874.1 sodium:solute symporter [Melioribacteraceae bacterium]MCF8417832.1 sodium:solute symporter [Melioribacteraceae bacterium]